MFKPRNALIPILILAVALPAFALEQRDREEVREQIRSVKIWQMTRDLGLSEKQAHEFFPALEDFENRSRQLREARHITQQELEMLLDEGQTDSERVQRLLVYLHDLDERERDIEQRFTRKRNGILTIRQQARYELFERKFRKNLRKMIQDIRDDERHGDERTLERREPKPEREDSKRHGKTATDRKSSTEKKSKSRDDSKKESGSDDKRRSRGDDDDSTGKKRGR